MSNYVSRSCPFVAIDIFPENPVRDLNLGLSILDLISVICSLVIISSFFRAANRGALRLHVLYISLCDFGFAFLEGYAHICGVSNNAIMALDVHLAFTLNFLVLSLLLWNVAFCIRLWISFCHASLSLALSAREFVVSFVTHVLVWGLAAVIASVGSYMYSNGFNINFFYILVAVTCVSIVCSFIVVMRITMEVRRQRSYSSSNGSPSPADAAKKLWLFPLPIIACFLPFLIKNILFINQAELTFATFSLLSFPSSIFGIANFVAFSFSVRKVRQMLKKHLCGCFPCCQPEETPISSHVYDRRRSAGKPNDRFFGAVINSSNESSSPRSNV